MPRRKITDRDAAWREYWAKPRDLARRNRLVELYLPLVKYQATKLAAKLPAQFEADDLISPGVFGLMNAIKKFDPGRGVKFETFSIVRIRGAMLDELRNQDWVPRQTRRRQKAGECDVVVIESLSQSYHQGEGRDVTLNDVLDDARAELPTDQLNASDFWRTATRGLNKSERLIVLGYYREQMTMCEIGEMLGLSESRISQMHKELLARLATRLAGRRSELAA